MSTKKFQLWYVLSPKDRDTKEYREILRYLRVRLIEGADLRPSADKLYAIRREPVANVTRRLGSEISHWMRVGIDPRMAFLALVGIR